MAEMLEERKGSPFCAKRTSSAPGAGERKMDSKGAPSGRKNVERRILG